MPPRMAFSKTIPQMRRREKDVTRRSGWWDVENDEPRVQPGDMLIAIEKGMGLQRGDTQTVICPIEVVSIRREPLSAIDDEDLVREGFPGMSREDFFIRFGGSPGDVITRIEFTYSLSPRNHVEFKIGRKDMDALFRDALSGFVKKRPPRWIQAWADDHDAMRVQDWVVTHLRHNWMTGIGAIEASEQMLVESLSNGNLNDDYPWRRDGAVQA